MKKVERIEKNSELNRKHQVVKDALMLTDKIRVACEENIIQINPHGYEEVYGYFVIKHANNKHMHIGLRLGEGKPYIDLVVERDVDAKIREKCLAILDSTFIKSSFDKCNYKAGAWTETRSGIEKKYKKGNFDMSEVLSDIDYLLPILSNPVFKTIK